MKSAAQPTRHFWRLLAFGALLAATALSVSGEEETVQLPPMLLQEKVKLPPWRYTRIAGLEVLSRCEDTTTKDFLRSYLHMQHVLRALVPDAFLWRQEMPYILLLVGQDSMQLMSREVIADMEKRERQRPRQPQAGFLPHLTLSDSEVSAYFVMLNEAAEYRRDFVYLRWEQLRRQLQNRIPPLPLWLIEGLTEFYRSSRLRDNALVFDEATWLDDAETRAIRGDSEYPRALLPMREILERETIAPPATENAEAYERRWRSQVSLFVRWALTSKRAERRAAFWQYVAALDRVPPSEALFERFFQLGYSDMQERLSDFLSEAVATMPVIEQEAKEPGTEPILRDATVAEISRLRGEWERLEIAYVRSRFPPWTEAYIDQARNTLRRAYDQGSMEAPLMAAIGIFEGEMDNAEAAAWFLNAAAEAKVPRPRVYLELARLHYRETAGHPSDEIMPNDQLPARAIELLETAQQFRPPLAGVNLLLAQLRSSAGKPVTPAQLTEFEQAARNFPRVTSLVTLAVLAHVQAGKSDTAIALLLQGLRFAPTPEDRQRLEKLRDSLWERP